MDSGYDTATFTSTFRGVGLTAADSNQVLLNGDSYLTCAGLQINVNQRDAAIWYSWMEEGDAESLHYMKVRWKGSSHYSGSIDHEWEAVLLSNGDVILRLIQLGTNSGTFTFAGKTYSITTSMTTCFYRKNYFGIDWEILSEEYTPAHHHSAADVIFVSSALADCASALTDGMAIVNNAGHDDDTVNLPLYSSFTWHGNSTKVHSRFFGKTN